MNTVRRLNEKDLENYKNLRQLAFNESSECFSESFEDEKDLSPLKFITFMGNHEEHFTVGAFNQNDLVGIATYKRDQRTKARHKSFIHTMYVHPHFRRQKIADLILQNIISHARIQNGLEQIHLWVLNPETSGARKLYERSGFKAQGPMVSKDLIINNSYVDALYMMLDFYPEKYEKKA